MYITVMDFSTSTVTKLVWDVEKASNEEVEALLESVGYHLSQVSYMTSDEEPDVNIVEVSDVIGNDV